jgi:hypothetical protein
VLVIGDGLYLSGIVGAAMKKQVINRIVNYCFNILCAKVSLVCLQARKNQKTGH